MYTNITRTQKESLTFNLKSDTVTLPTQEMRDAMTNAEVGDDVTKEDPTVVQLENLVASFFGKEAGLFVPSGTMGNLISVMTHCRERGSEFLVGDLAHIYYYEQGGAASLGGVHPRSVPTQPDGTLDLGDIEERIREEDDHFPVTKLVCLENTHNKKGGRVLSPEYINQVADLCEKNSLKLHIDGARIMNAVASYPDVDPKDYFGRVDSISICLSKALGAPVGTVIVGTSDFMYQARRLRKALGGGMRQVGVLAAPAIIAFEKMRLGLTTDHENTKLFAERISSYDGVTLDSVPETNIIFFTVNRSDMDGKLFTKQMAEQGVLFGSYGDSRVRACFHYDIKPEDLETIFARLDVVLGSQ